MSIVNINTASKQKLMTLGEIGEARAKLIITAREAKGTLKLEDIKMIEGLPNTMWDPLVAAGKITFEIPEEQMSEIEKLKIQYDIKITEMEEEKKKIRNNFETQIFIAQQKEQTTKQELKNEIMDLQLQLGTESEEKNLYSKALNELKQEMAHETETIEDVHRENMEKIKLQLAQEKERNIEINNELIVLDTSWSDQQKDLDEQRNQLAIEKEDTRHTLETMENKFLRERSAFKEKLKHYVEKLEEHGNKYSIQGEGREDTV